MTFESLSRSKSFKVADCTLVLRVQRDGLPVRLGGLVEFLPAVVQDPEVDEVDGLGGVFLDGLLVHRFRL